MVAEPLQIEVVPVIFAVGVVLLTVTTGLPVISPFVKSPIQLASLNSVIEYVLVSEGVTFIV